MDAVHDSDKPHVTRLFVFRSCRIVGTMANNAGVPAHGCRVVSAAIHRVKSPDFAAHAVAILAGFVAGQAGERNRFGIITHCGNLQVVEPGQHNDEVTTGRTAEAGHAIDDPDAVRAVAIVDEERGIILDLARKARADRSSGEVRTAECCCRCRLVIGRRAETNDQVGAVRGNREVSKGADVVDCMAFRRRGKRAFAMANPAALEGRQRGPWPCRPFWSCWSFRSFATS